MLQPRPDWQWFIDEKSNRLAIAVAPGANMLTCVRQSDIASGLEANRSFTLEDMATLTEIQESLLDSGIAAHAERDFIALHALAARQFYRMQGLKSWYFDAVGEADTHSGEQGVGRLVNPYGQFVVMVLAKEQGSVTCLTLDDSTVLDQSKTLNRFSVLKVSVDRLHQSLNKQSHWYKSA